MYACESAYESRFVGSRARKDKKETCCIQEFSAAASVLHNILTGLSKFMLGNITTYDQLTFLPGESRNSRSCIILQKLGKGSIVWNICPDTHC